MLVTFGMGLTWAATTAAATSGAAREDAGIVSGLNNAARQVGGAIGLAALATISLNHARHLILTAGAHPAGALTSGYDLAFLLAAGCLIASAIVALTVLPSTPQSRSPRGHTSQPGACTAPDTQSSDRKEILHA